MHLHYHRPDTPSRGNVVPSPSAPALVRGDRSPSGASLGIYGKSCNPPPSESLKARRIERFALQSVARSVLPNHTVSKCCRNPVGSSVHIKGNHSTGEFRYRNLETCKSVWVCPVCASKITEKRRHELSYSVDTWKEIGGSVLLLTLTVQHNRSDSFLKSIDGLQTAYRKFLNRKVGKRLFDNLGVQGRIRALEVTYGENGWHPHFHVLLFVRHALRPEMLQTVQNTLLESWASCCQSSGLNKPNSHGLTLQDGSYADKYVGKWGLEYEMTKGHTKQSRSGYSPFDLLRSMLGTYQGNGIALAPGQAAALYRDYVSVMTGRRQLVWSDGLRDLLGMEPIKSDEELEAEITADEYEFMRVPLDIWKIVLKAEKRGELLEVCRSGVNAVHEYLARLYSDHGGG